MRYDTVEPYASCPWMLAECLLRFEFIEMRRPLKIVNPAVNISSFYMSSILPLPSTTPLSLSLIRFLACRQYPRHERHSRAASAAATTPSGPPRIPAVPPLRIHYIDMPPDRGGALSRPQITAVHSLRRTDNQLLWINTGLASQRSAVNRGVRRRLFRRRQLTARGRSARNTEAAERQSSRQLDSRTDRRMDS